MKYSGRLDQYGQEFAFSPTQQFMGQINEVEMRFANEETGIRVWMEVDCKSGYKEIEENVNFI
ncbi:sporulation protein [Peribacillus butanolivorans]|uniref:sporulation protein n=1 Tax=Peribacillus butanolivorans TaxID=421767 RepID=UPI00207D0A3B|nr:sporulation protein [Peribacillus butanolivorans]MCO0598520.1 sporulation protein [Peribacillus butanolivorans]